MKTKKFRQPILAWIYGVVGGVVVIAGLIAAIALMFGAKMVPDATGTLPSGLLGGLAVLILTLVAALPFFGIAQVISHIGKTAYFAENLSHTMTLSMMEINLTATQILEHLKTIEKLESRRDPGAGSERMAECPFCKARIPLRNLHKGVNLCPECQRTVEME